MTTSFAKPAIQYSQSGRRAWVTTLSVKDLEQLQTRQQPVQLEMLTEYNRPINRHHLSSLHRFLLDNDNWALPAIVLSASPGAVAQEGGNISATASSLQILDGQHRIQAFAELRTQLITQGTDEARGKLQALEAQELSAVIIETNSPSEHRQLFAWFARTRPIDAATREYFDQSDPYAKAAKDAMERSVVLNGRVLYTATSLPRRGPDQRKLTTLRQLKELPTVIHIGIGRAPRPADREIAWQENVQSDLSDSLVQFFDQFLPSCAPNYEVLDDTAALDASIVAHRHQHYSLEPQMLRLVADVWSRHTKDRSRDPVKLSQVIGSLNLRRTDPGNDVLNKLALADPEKHRFERPRSPAWYDASKTLLELAQ